MWRLGTFRWPAVLPLWRWCLGLLMGAMAAWSHAAAMPITQVEVAQGDWGPSIERRPAEGWASLNLPDAWLISKRSGTWTYRFELNVCAPAGQVACVAPDQLKALWIPKVGRELTVWINGVRVLYLGPVGQVEQDITRRPVLVTIPTLLLHPGVNEFRLVVTGPSHQILGLSRVWVGAERDLMMHHATRDYLLMGMPAAVAAGGAILAVLSLLIALRFGGTCVWLFCLISTIWTIRELLLLFGFFFLPLDTILALAQLLQGVALLLSCWLLLDLMALSDRRWVLLLQWLLAGAPLAAVGWWLGGTSLWLWTWGWHGLTNFTALCMTFVALFAMWRQPSWPRVTVGLGMLGAAILCSMDEWQLLLSRQHLGFEHVPLTSLMAVTFLLSVSASVYMRVARALKVEARHKHVLEEEVRKQREELQRLHARESERLKAETITDERARIVREMHDGLGAQLVGLLSTVESGAYTQAELAGEVSEAMGHLRLTIDTLDPLGHDLASLLGQLRFRLDSRLRKAGLKLLWQVRPLPVMDHLGASELGHLQRLLFEAFTNVIKHAGATEVRVCASFDEQRQCIDIRIRDNGCGFHVHDAPEGRGVNNMRYRAAQIGADLCLDAEPGEGTELSVTLHVPPRQA